MNGVSRFLSKRDRKAKDTGADGAAKCAGACPELYRVFTPEETKKKADKEEEKKVKAVTQRLTQLGIANLREAQIEYALRAKTTNGDVEKATDLLQVFEDSVEGIVREYQPTLKLLGAENREAVTCYLDALLFAMFAKLDSFEALLFDTFTDTPRKNLASLLRLWVNMLRSGKLITTDIVKHIQTALAECGWEDASLLRQQDTSEAFTFITDKLQLPLLTLKMDIYHYGKEDVKDDHRVVHERLLEVAIPEKQDGTVTLEECLENYFNNRIEVKRHLQRRNTLQSLRSYQAAKSEAVHIETAEVEASPSPSRPTSPAAPLTESPVAQTSSSLPAFLSSRLRTDSIFSEKRVPFEQERGRAQDDVSIRHGRPRAGTIRREVLMPAWQFFSLIPWYTDDTSNPTTDAQVAAHFSTKRPVLGICLKRYQMQGNGHSRRLNTHIDIPLEIALPEFVSDEHKYEDFGDFKLSLESVVCHRGVSTHAGHYISLVRGVAPKSPSAASAGDSAPATPWMRFDDLAAERVTPVDIGKALKEESPYLLFYQVQPIDDDLPPSYAEAQRDSPPQHPVEEGQIIGGSESDLSSSGVLAGHPALVSSTDVLQASTRKPSHNDLQASGATIKPVPISRNDSKHSGKGHVGASTDSMDFATSTAATSASTSNYELGTAAGSARGSLELPRRRASVAFDDASFTPAGTATPSVSGTASASASVKTPSTAPVTPADEGLKSWLPNITGSRRNSRSEKGRSSDAGKNRDKRPSSQSGENRLSLTMSRLSGKLSKDKLLNNIMLGTNNSNPSAAANSNAAEDETVITVTECETNDSRPPTLRASEEYSAGAAPSSATPRASFDLLALKPPLPAVPVDNKLNGNSSSVARSRSLRHKHKLGGTLGGFGKDVEKRSKSHGREVQSLSAQQHAVPERGSVEVLDRDGAVAIAAAQTEIGDGSLRKKKRGPGHVHGHAHGHGHGHAGGDEAYGGAARPDRECAVM